MGITLYFVKPNGSVLLILLIGFEDNTIYQPAELLFCARIPSNYPLLA